MKRLPLPVRAGLAGLLGAVVGFLLAAVAWALWAFSEALIRPPVYLQRRQRAFVEGDGVQGDEVTLQLSHLSRSPGQLGLEWEQEDGEKAWAVLGAVSRSEERGQVRPILNASAPLPDRTPVRPVPNVYGGTPAQLGLEYQEIELSTSHGPVPAWFLPDGADWIIFVHGHGGSRSETMRALPTVQRLGLSALTMSYRNSREGPATPDRLIRLGESEWQDVEVALQFAQEHGARQVILFGYSMGGAIVLNTLRRSKLAAELVRGAVLDSPALDWSGILRGQAKRMRLPAAGALAVEWAASARLRRPLGAVNQFRTASELNVPLLIIHGDADETVPVIQSETLARLRPDLVQLHKVPGAAHIRAWNLDPSAYEAALTDWLERVLE